MTSLLTLLSSSGLAFDMYSHLIKCKDFHKFMNKCNEQGDLKTIVSKFVKNSILSYFDEKLKDIFTDKSFDEVFTNKTLDKLTQIKFCLGKIAIKFADSDKYVQIGEGKMHVSFIIQFISSVVSTLPGFDPEKLEIKCFKDCYNELVDHFCYNIDEILNPDVFTRDSSGPLDIEGLADIIEFISKQINETLDYQSPTKRKRDDDTIEPDAKRTKR